MSEPLMPKATAEWLIENTMLTFEQIAEFCSLHKLEVQALADDEINTGIMAANPINRNELTQEEIKRCEEDSSARLVINKSDLPKPKSRVKGPRYTPVAKRAEKPNAALFLIKKYPDMTDIQIAKLVGSTKPTVESIRNRTHSNMTNLKPSDPLLIGLCKKADLQKIIDRNQRKIEREAKAKVKAAKLATKEAEASKSNENAVITIEEAQVPMVVAEEKAPETENAAEDQTPTAKTENNSVAV